MCDYEELLAGVANATTFPTGPSNTVLILPPITPSQQKAITEQGRPSTGTNHRQSPIKTWRSESTVLSESGVKNCSSADDLVLMHHYTLYTSGTIVIVDGENYHSKCK